MTDTRTIGDMQDRIADELARTDLGSQILDAIRSAVNHYATERFWFNEFTYFTITTSSSLEFYALPADLEDIDNFDIDIGGNLLPLYQRSYAEISDKQTGNSFGQPYEFALYNSSVFFFPIPNGAYATVLSYQRTLDSLSATTDTNDFMTFGEELIRSRARADIELNVLHDETARAEYLQSGPLGYYCWRERVAHQAMVRRTKRRRATNTLMGSGIY